MSSVRVLLFLIFSFSLASNATPTIREQYSDDYLKLVEEIFDNHNVDIMNRDLYEGYTMKFHDKCNSEVKLKTYSSLIKIFNVNICNNQSKISSERI